MRAVLRVTAILLAVALLAGCGSAPATPPASSRPATTAPATPSPVPTQSPSPTPTASSRPALGTSCSDIPAAYRVPTVRLAAEDRRFHADFGPSTIIPHEYPGLAFSMDPAVDAEVGVLPGGYPMSTELWLDYDAQNVREEMTGISMASVAAEMTLADGRRKVLTVEWAKVQSTLWTLVVRGLPDVDATAHLDITVEWTDRCFRYAAAAALPEVQLASKATTDGCIVDEAAYRMDLEAALAAPLKVGPGDVTLTSPLNEAKFVDLVSPGIDVHPAYVWDQDGASISADPGEALDVHREAGSIELLTLRSVIWTRGSVIEAIKAWPPQEEFVVVEEAFPEREPDGSFQLVAPDEAGRYVAALDFAFDSRCTTGQAWAVFSFNVE